MAVMGMSIGMSFVVAFSFRAMAYGLGWYFRVILGHHSDGTSSDSHVVIGA